MLRLEIFALIFAYLSGTALGHGYLTEPPGRASAWRFGFDTPVDYNDNQCFCGGFDYQYNMNGGKCGICGDPYDQNPRDHEVGGLYATGTIVRDYTQGQVVPITANVTVNHLGHFEYKLCANNEVTVEATQDCLDLTPLYAVGHDDWHLGIGDAWGGVSFDLQLPADLTCSQCVLQWRYVAGNTWGTCENGTQSEGCGPQEEFRGCADVSISAAVAAESPASSPEKVAQEEQQSTRAKAEALSENIDIVQSEEEFQSEEDSRFGEQSLSLVESVDKENSEENANRESDSYSTLRGQPQRALKLVEEMAVVLGSNSDKRSAHEEEISEKMKTETMKDDEDDDAFVDVEEEEHDGDNDSESEDDE